MKTYSISHEAVKATQLFKGSNPRLQHEILRHYNLEKIQNGVNISQNRGHEYYLKITGHLHFIREIVRELFEGLKE